jgi:cation transporter-like permease
MIKLDTFKNYWRPLAAVTYLLICLFDFIIGPIFWTVMQAGPTLMQWVPLTLQNNGLFHLSFGAILSTAAYTRGMEKIATLHNQQPAQVSSNAPY